MFQSNQKFFEKIYSEHFEVVYIKVKNNLRSNVEDDITSCVQETFIVALNKIEELRKHENISAFLLATAKNISDNFNTKYILRCNLIDSTIEIEKIPQDIDYEEEIIEEAQYVKYLKDGVPERFINQLSKREQELYFLKYIEKRTNDDIAKILNISINAVASRTLRLKQKFKDEFL